MAKFRCFQKVLYMGREVTIVGVSHLGFSRHKNGTTYDVRVDRGTHSYDYKNIPEKHLTEIPKPKQNEVIDMVQAANRLKYEKI